VTFKAPILALVLGGIFAVALAMPTLFSRPAGGTGG